MQQLPSNESDIVRQNQTVREDATVTETAGIAIGLAGQILNVEMCQNGHGVSLCLVPDARVSSRPLPELDPCVVCQRDERTHVAISCGHFAFCGNCVSRLRHLQAICPLCRAVVQDFINVQRLPPNEPIIVPVNPTVPATNVAVDNERKVSQCVFCGEARSVHIVVPCGHTSCDTCAQQHPRNGISGAEDHCPRCSAPIHFSIRFYLA